MTTLRVMNKKFKMLFVFGGGALVLLLAVLTNSILPAMGWLALLFIFSPKYITTVKED